MTLREYASEIYTGRDKKKQTTFSAFYRNITDLDGIEEYENLCTLVISGNNIKSLEGIQNLKKLTHLYCFDNKISCIKPLHNLDKLIHLEIDKNLITSFDDFGEKPNIKYLKCDTDKISSYSLYHALKEYPPKNIDIEVLKQRVMSEKLKKLGI